MSENSKKIGGYENLDAGMMREPEGGWPEILRGAKFPELHQAQMVQDPQTGMTWVGVPLKNLDPLSAITILDGFKPHVMAWYKALLTKSEKPGIIRATADALKGALSQIKH